MPSDWKDKYARAKALDFQTYLERITGVSGEVEGGYIKFPCPIHGGTDKNLKLSKRTGLVACYSHSCIERGTIIDLVMAMNPSMSNNEAVLLLLNESLPVAPPRKIKPSEMKHPKPLDILDGIFDNAAVRDQFAISRGISIPIATALKMGVQRHSRTFMVSDSQSVTAKIKYFTIPSVFDGKVFGVKGRRYDSDVRQFWDVGLDDTQREYISNRFEGDWDKILDYIGGHRYSFWADTALPFIYAYSILVDKFTKVRRNLDHLFITEGELCAASILSKGFNAVAYKGVRLKNDPAWYFENVGKIYIVQDPDKAGEKYANKTFDLIRNGRHDVHIVETIGEHDANDMVRFGEWDEWVTQFEVTPVENMENFIW